MKYEYNRLLFLHCNVNWFINYMIQKLHVKFKSFLRCIGGAYFRF